MGIKKNCKLDRIWEKENYCERRCQADGQGYHKSSCCEEKEEKEKKEEQEQEKKKNKEEKEDAFGETAFGETAFGETAFGETACAKCSDLPSPWMKRADVECADVH